MSTDGDTVWVTRTNELGFDESTRQLRGSAYDGSVTTRRPGLSQRSSPAGFVTAAGTDTVQLIAPLGGNPGIMSSVLMAGAVAGYQPQSWAWDQIIAYMAALLDLPVMRLDTGAQLTPREITDMFVKGPGRGSQDHKPDRRQDT